MTPEKPSRRGFTLVELMVSITGGLFVSIAVFMLAKQSTSLYQSEGRAGNATVGSLVGFERLRQDIERAAFLSTPMIRRDPKLCGDPIGDANWPKYLKHLQGVMITQPTNTSVIPAVLANNGSRPDELTLAGSYISDEKYYADTISAVGGADQVALESDKGGLVKRGYLSLQPAAQATLLASLFPAGRALRVVDKSNGREVYGTIASVQGGVPPIIILRPGAGGPSLIYRSGSPLKCGIAGVSRSSVVNVVNVIHYSIRRMTTGFPQYAPLFNNAGFGPADEANRRTELVREELDTEGEPIADTQEIVSEFAVDLKFGVTVGHVISGTTQVFKLESFGPGDPTVGAWAGDTTTVVGPAAAMPPTGAPAPQLVRAVRVRLGVRSREADRPTGLDGGTGLPMAPGLYRIGTNPIGGGPYARVRTLQADVALRNQQGVTFL
jgi:hypothetical protein